MATEIERSRRLFTVAEYDRMAAAGIVRPGDRVELINGEIVEMTPIGPAHAAAVAALTRILVTGVGERGVVWVQNPVVVSPDSEPEPDVAVLRARSYRQAHPQSDDVVLVAEIAETSLRYDQTVKRDLYARAGIPEYWVVDTTAAAIDVFRPPTAAGYAEARRIGRGGTVSPSAFPDLAVRIADLFT